MPLLANVDTNQRKCAILMPIFFLPVRHDAVCLRSSFDDKPSETFKYRSNFITFRLLKQIIRAILSYSSKGRDALDTFFVLKDGASTFLS